MVTVPLSLIFFSVSSACAVPATANTVATIAAPARNDFLMDAPDGWKWLERDLGDGTKF